MIQSFKLLLGISILFVSLSCTTKTKNKEIQKEIVQLENELAEEDFLNDGNQQESEPAKQAAELEDEEEIFAEEGEELVEEEPVEEEPTEDQEEVAVSTTEEDITETSDPLTEEDRVFRDALTGPPLDIQNIEFLANNKGGTIVITTSARATFKTRSTPETNQFIVEVANANLPANMTRPYILKEFRGTDFKQINAYQKSGSMVARVVVQLAKPMSPMVQQEENSIMIFPQSEVSQKVTKKSKINKNDEKINNLMGLNPGAPLGPDAPESEGEWDVNIDYSKGGTPESYINYEPAEETKRLLLSARTLDEYLLKHDKFYGKPISIQVKDAGVKDVIGFLGEEAGLNMVIDESVSGKITVKLRKVPWDQALILVMKSKNLGYIRQGSVIRIAPLARLETEKSAARQIIEARNDTEPLQVKILPVSYANPGAMLTQVTQFLTSRGKAVADERTSTLVVTDIEENILKAQKIVEELDVPPYQILIEGKIVEAVETYSNSVGINWLASGQQVVLSESGGANGGPITLFPNLSINPVPQGTGGTASLQLSIGTLEILGNLDAQVALLEKQDLAKVISSPRIITLNREAASFSQSVAIPYLTATVDSAGGAQPTVQFQNLSLSLQVTPQVTNSGRVIMEVTVSRTIPSSSGAVVGGASSTTSSAATTKVMVKNNQSAVVGGIYSGTNTMGQNRVPVVSNIPVLGWLFKSKSSEQSKTELVIFITPRIIDSKIEEDRERDEVLEAG